MPAYNNYYPMSYQPYMYQAQAQPQMPAQSPQMPQIQQTGMIWVNSMLEAQNYPVAPNNAVALWDSTSSTIYLKQADASGRPSFKTFDLVERTQASNAKAESSVEYATKDELNVLVESIKKMQGEMSTLKAKKRRVVEEDDE